MIKGIIFDMDGLMIDSEIITYYAHDHIVKSYGYDFSLDFFKTLLGNNPQTIKNKYIKQYGNDFPFDDFLIHVHQYIHNHFITYGVPLKKGLLPLLDYLKEHHYKMIVATGSQRNRVQQILHSSAIDHYFIDAVCGDEVIKGKPDPETFIKACEKLHLNKDEVLVLEDSEAGILAAYNGGMKVICIPDLKEHNEDINALAEGVYDSLEDVISYLECQKGIA